MDTPARPVPWEKPLHDAPRAMKRAGMLVDLRRCTGCHSCSISCKTEHEVPLGSFRTRVHYVPKPDSLQIAYVPLLCMHCQDAPCIPACPNQALVKLDDQRVVVDQDTCDGSKDCVSACPYDAIAIHPQTNKAEKCDFCEHRTAAGLEPACVEACPTTALRFGDLDDADDPVTRYAEQHGAAAYKADAGTKPNVVYIGHEKWIEDRARGVQRHEGEAGIVYE